MLEAVREFFKVDSTGELIWVIVGLAAQLTFSMRFILQWWASEKEGRSVIPEVFWWFSIGGGLTLFAYALHRQDPVFILGQSLGVFIYARNLWLIYAEKRASSQEV
ncbi:lipid-A-disaccharide synthase N-terminal domain-containing protein [Phaeobacter sp. HF9A]|uniref:lipid-A-disaccharide synthase N-terminal domain-containing protein n=1 Tax=Phaeobacter sp. HF9A TaxID=2721561 RepID=UPI0014302A27|nr:lipid-A-disaccharide synthase N-terminal domain-containing protein [Phaeobacter sp. HF9A]NIZ13431.1 lipid A biosynthesis protein [Phaeobacter sp. HF9A]